MVAAANQKSRMDLPATVESLVGLPATTWWVRRQVEVVGPETAEAAAGLEIVGVGDGSEDLRRQRCGSRTRNELQCRCQAMVPTTVCQTGHQQQYSLDQATYQFRIVHPENQACMYILEFLSWKEDFLQNCTDSTM